MNLREFHLPKRLNYYLELFVVLVILANVALMVFDSIPELHHEYEALFDAFNLIFLCIFIIEYLLRLIASKKKLSYIFSFYGLIDLVAITPDLLMATSGLNTSFVKIIRLFRIARIAKVGRVSKTIHTLGEVIFSVRGELFVTLGVCFIILFFSSAGIYYLENPVQPESFSSIIDSFWWSVSSLTGVVMEDRYPVTLVGKIFATLVSMVGVGVVAIPTGIISASFVEVMHARKERKKR